MNQNKTSKGWLSIILNSSYFLDLIYISGGMGLKKYEDVIQQRNFSQKGLLNWKLWIFDIYIFFWILFWFFRNFSEFLNAKTRGL